jgi:hypothetical protein
MSKKAVNPIFSGGVGLMGLKKLAERKGVTTLKYQAENPYFTEVLKNYAAENVKQGVHNGA